MIKVIIFLMSGIVAQFGTKDNGLGNAVKIQVRASTVAALPAHTHTGNVITASANGVFPAQDGVTLLANDDIDNRLLINIFVGGQALKNGIWFVSDSGSVSTPWTLTRSSDFNTSAKVKAGLIVVVTEGTVSADTMWELATNNPITLNTTVLTFLKISSTFTGSGILNYLARWTSGTALGTGVSQDNGTTTSIGSAAPISSALNYITGLGSTFATYGYYHLNSIGAQIFATRDDNYILADKIRPFSAAGTLRLYNETEAGFIQLGLDGNPGVYVLGYQMAAGARLLGNNLATIDFKLGAKSDFQSLQLYENGIDNAHPEIIFPNIRPTMFPSPPSTRGIYFEAGALSMMGGLLAAPNAFPTFNFNINGAGTDLKIRGGLSTGTGIPGSTIIQVSTIANDTLTYNTLVGAFIVGETITGGTSGFTGVVKTDAAGTMTVNALTGTPAPVEVITGGTSAATANMLTFIGYNLGASVDLVYFVPDVLGVKGNIGIGTTAFGTAASLVISQSNTGVSPTSSPANVAQMYCADRAAGATACHFFRNEEGHIIKLFQGAALTTALTNVTASAPGTPDYAIQDLVVAGFGFVTADEGQTVLSVIRNLQDRINALEARLQAHGLLA